MSVCDGARDCPNGDDEAEQCVCREYELKCERGGGCYTERQKCDNTTDCLDGSDEFQCSKLLMICTHVSSRAVANSNFTFPIHLTVFGKCNELQYTCPSGKCIDQLSLCDGDYDCPSGEDELGCDCAANEVFNFYFYCFPFFFVNLIFFRTSVIVAVDATPYHNVAMELMTALTAAMNTIVVSSYCSAN